MALVKVSCTKCGQSSRMDIGELKKEEVIKVLSNDKNGFHCFGNHVEFGNRIDYWTIDWDSIEEGSAPTEEEFLDNLKSKCRKVYEKNELEANYNIIGFAESRCVTENKKNGKREIFDFVHSPKGKRYYYIK